jgi:DNA-binding Xre family transcriptional regulator
MNTKQILEELKRTSKKNTKWIQDALWQKENEVWLDRSFAIAVKVLRTLRAQKRTQKELAEEMGVSPQFVNKIVKGSENLTLETISKLEKALKVQLIDIKGFESPSADALVQNNPEHDTI